MNEPLVIRTTEADGSVRRRFHEPSAGVRLRAPPKARRMARVRPSLAYAASVLSVAGALVGSLALGGD